MMMKYHQITCKQKKYKSRANNDELSPNYLQNASQIIASYEQNIKKSQWQIISTILADH